MLNELEQKIRKAMPELQIFDKGNETKSSRYKIVELVEIPIQLNHVLEYVQYKDVIFSLLLLWNLKSNLLSEQSEELIKFINEL